MASMGLQEVLEVVNIGHRPMGDTIDHWGISSNAPEAMV